MQLSTPCGSVRRSSSPAVSTARSHSRESLETPSETHGSERHTGRGSTLSLCTRATARLSTTARALSNEWKGPPHWWWRTAPSRGRSNPLWPPVSWPPWSQCACDCSSWERALRRSPFLSSDGNAPSDLRKWRPSRWPLELIRRRERSQPAVVSQSAARGSWQWHRYAGRPGSWGIMGRRRPPQSRSEHKAGWPETHSLCHWSLLLGFASPQSGRERRHRAELWNDLGWPTLVTSWNFTGIRK